MRFRESLFESEENETKIFLKKPNILLSAIVKNKFLMRACTENLIQQIIKLFCLFTIITSLTGSTPCDYKTKQLDNECT